MGNEQSGGKLSRKKDGQGDNFARKHINENRENENSENELETDISSMETK